MPSKKGIVKKNNVKNSGQIGHSGYLKMQIFKISMDPTGGAYSDGTASRLESHTKPKSKSYMLNLAMSKKFIPEQFKPKWPKTARQNLT